MNQHGKRGYTLIELALSLVVIGVITVVVWRFGSSAGQRIDQMEAPQTLIAADQALVGFIAAHHRLPCPDTSGNGTEDCTASVGRLPVVALGLARADLLNVRYGVFRSAANNADLAVASDRYFPLLASIPPSAGIGSSGITAPLGSVNGIDFCHAVRLAGALPGGASSLSTALNIRTPNSTIIKNVAYALSLPGTGSDPATNQNAVANSFASPGQPISMGYRDSVLAVDFGQIFDRLSCGGILASAGHSHPNAASAAAIMRGAFLDYKVQLDLEAELSDVGVLSAGVGVASAAGGLLSAASETLTAASETVLSLGALAPVIALAAVGVALSAAGVVSAAFALDSAITTQTIAHDRVKEFSGTDPTSIHLLEDAGILATTLRANVVAADAAGIY